MKIFILVLLLIMANILCAAEPMVGVAQKELDKSKHFLKLEKIKRAHLYDYTKMVKSRYLRMKKIPFLSQNISNSLSLKVYTYKKVTNE